MTAILENIINPGQSGFFELDPATHMTPKKVTQIVSEIQHSSLSAKLQIDPNLTLENQYVDSRQS